NARSLPASASTWPVTSAPCRPDPPAWPSLAPPCLAPRSRPAPQQRWRHGSTGRHHYPAFLLVTAGPSAAPSASPIPVPPRAECFPARPTKRLEQHTRHKDDVAVGRKLTRAHHRPGLLDDLLQLRMGDLAQGD